MTRLILALCLPSLLVAEVVPPVGPDMRGQITSNTSVSAAAPVAVTATPRLSTLQPWQALAQQLGFTSWQWASTANPFAVTDLTISISVSDSTTRLEALEIAAQAAQSNMSPWHAAATAASFTSGECIRFELGLPKDFAQFSAVGRAALPEAITKAKALLDKFGARPTLNDDL